jgi:hypothetical protein
MARTEGNPLFLEEVVRALREGGSADLAIPENVRALLLARIDRLEEGARRALTAAGYPGPWDVPSMLSAYERAAPPPPRTYSTRNGDRTEAQLQTELAAAGYLVPWDISSMLAAYAGAVAPPLPSLPPVLTLRDIEGRAFLVANDGQYLGKLSSNHFDSESICNDFGSYGSRFSSTSIRQQFSSYGSDFSSLSPYDQFTSTPPLIIFEGQVVGYLTKNSFLRGAVDPDIALAAYGCSR